MSIRPPRHGDRFTLPADPVAVAALRTVREAEHPTLVDHSVRSYWLARDIAARTGIEVPDDLLFAATILHELGAGSTAPGRERFEIEGADLAASLLQDLGVDEPAIEQVWDAIALHTSAGLAERRGPLARVVRAGIIADFGPSPDDDGLRRDLERVWPRGRLETVLVDAILERAREPEALPHYGIGGVLAHERAAHGRTSIEGGSLATSR